MSTIVLQCYILIIDQLFQLLLGDITQRIGGRSLSSILGRKLTIDGCSVTYGTEIYNLQHQATCDRPISTEQDRNWPNKPRTRLWSQIRAHWRYQSGVELDRLHSCWPHHCWSLSDMETAISTIQNHHWQWLLITTKTIFTAQDSIWATS